MNNKRKVLLFLVFTMLISSLSMFACTDKGNNSNEQTKKEPITITEQREELNNNVLRMMKKPEYMHMLEAPSEYKELLRNVGVKMPNMPNNGKRTLLLYSWNHCPHCMNESKEIVDKWKEEDFNIVIYQAENTDKSELSEEDKKKAIEKEKEETRAIYKENGIEKLLDYSVFENTTAIGDELDVYYYPTLLFLDKDGKIINVSGSLSYENILKMFEISGAPAEKTEENKEEEQKEETVEDNK